MSSSRRGRGRRILPFLASIFFLVVAVRWLILPSAGSLLVKADSPAKAEVAIVLGGDSWGNRILRGADLKRQGLVDKVLVSGGPGLYGFYESDLAVRFAVSNGFPEDYFEPLHELVLSTQDEAHSIVQHLKRRGCKRVLVVTSNYHTRRAGRIWRYTAPWLDIRMVAARDRSFRSEYWWRDRESGKLVLNEWAKFAAFTFDFFPPTKSGPVSP